MNARVLRRGSARAAWRAARACGATRTVWRFVLSLLIIPLIPRSSTAVLCSAGGPPYTTPPPAAQFGWLVAVITFIISFFIVHCSLFQFIYLVHLI